MAAGPKRVFGEFSEKAETIRKTVESLDFALGHAPGCDLIEFEEWQAVSAELTKIAICATILRDLTKRLSDAAPEGTAEEIRAAKYPAASA